MGRTKTLAEALNVGRRDDERLFPRCSEAVIAEEFAEFLAGREKRRSCSHKSIAHPRDILRDDFCKRCGTRLKKPVH